MSRKVHFNCIAAKSKTFLPGNARRLMVFRRGLGLEPRKSSITRKAADRGENFLRFSCMYMFIVFSLAVKTEENLRRFFVFHSFGDH